MTNTHRADWDQLEAKLLWRYGLERASRILAAQDPATNADLAAWRSLGAGRGVKRLTPATPDSPQGSGDAR